MAGEVQEFAFPFCGRRHNEEAMFHSPDVMFGAGGGGYGTAALRDAFRDGQNYKKEIGNLLWPEYVFRQHTG